MTHRLAAAALAVLLSASPSVAADCAPFAAKLAKAEALDKANTKAFEERRTAESCRLMAEANAIRDDILSTTHDDCYTAMQSKIMIKMNRQTTAAVYSAMCGKP
ncbi:hypothetical protein [Methylopila sp. M107]|uniref:hypothetical protein n=1 Tax=Methylopila sp. M107 TaxID=1101190 RepID=UPI0003639648|nr:hypothetical protein [Methylopila sp. M107]